MEVVKREEDLQTKARQQGHARALRRAASGGGANRKGEKGEVSLQLE